MEQTQHFQEESYIENHLTDLGWRQSRQLLHVYAQIVGKIKLRLHPKLNHWWHATFSITPVGWSTGLIPYHEGCFEIEFNFISHQLVIKKSDGHFKLFSLHQPTVKAFHDELFNCLHALGIDVHIDEHPYDSIKVKTDIPFDHNQTAINYDEHFSYNLWQAFLEADIAFQKFKGRFIGKSSPVQLFWHSFDLALTFFSGRRGPPTTGMNKVTKEAYSHEVISFGFWGGDDDVDEPAFYSYVYPEPSELSEGLLKPREAYWKTLSHGTQAILPYKALNNHQPREQAILDFMESAFYNGVRKAHWNGDIARLIHTEHKKHIFTTH